MTTVVDIANRALLSIGIQNKITSVTQDSVEAATFNTIYGNVRDRLLRMAPWDCGLTYANLVYITSVPGTPQNTSPATSTWQKGQPAPPWAYEYQYPVDCMRACFIVPASQTGFADGIPITTAVTGGAPAFWQGQPIKFKIANDQFYAVTGVTIANGGSGYAVGDYITLAQAPAGTPPYGAPAVVQVVTVSGSAIASINLLNQLPNGTFGPAPTGGSYFKPLTNPQAQGSTTGTGTGATFNVTWASTLSDQRVILTNQEFPTIAYVKQVTDPNVMDPLFIDALVHVIAGDLTAVLTQNYQLANAKIQQANLRIAEARKVDGNEGLSLNDVTPDFIRTRGIAWTEYYQGPWANYDWGSYWPVY